MEFNDKALAQGAEVDRDLKKSRRNLKGLLKLFQGELRKSKPRPIRRVRDLYRYEKVSQMVFDLAMRILLNSGNWAYSVGVGMHRGFWAFQVNRRKFWEEARLRPPVHVSEAQALKDLERLLGEGRIRWEN